MAEKINDGGCAFPSDSMDGVDSAGNRMPFSPGMSLRDWFAGQALAGILANQERLQVIVSAADAQDVADAKVAKVAFAHADAMIATRSSSMRSAG